MIHSCQMRPRSLALLLSVCATPLAAQTSKGVPSDRQNLAQFHFESGLGFSYDVPSDLKVVSSKKFDATVRSEALQQATTQQEIKSINCTQQLLVAENSDESRIIYFVASPQGCATGAVNEGTIAALGQYSAREMSKRIAFVDPRYGTFKAGEHVFWIMRSEMTPKPPQNPNREFALLVTYTPSAVIECMISAGSPADFAELILTRLKFDDGAETELVPASAFAADH
jgi:hypothetical protein